MLAEHASHGTRIPEGRRTTGGSRRPPGSPRTLPAVQTQPLLPAARARHRDGRTVAPDVRAARAERRARAPHGHADPPARESVLSVLGLHDRATVYVDGREVGVLERETSHRGSRSTGTVSPYGSRSSWRTSAASTTAPAR
ncbi:hypothetical protein NKG05_14395 [Oerskovia sp. M15]